MSSISAISASTTDGSSAARDMARVYGSMESGAAIVVHCVIAIPFRCQHVDRPIRIRKLAAAVGSDGCGARRRGDRARKASSPVTPDAPEGIPLPGQALTGALAAAASLCTRTPSSVITVFSSIALAASGRSTVILRGLAFSATGITSRSTPSR